MRLFARSSEWTPLRRLSKRPLSDPTSRMWEHSVVGFYIHPFVNYRGRSIEFLMSVFGADIRFGGSDERIQFLA